MLLRTNVPQKFLWDEFTSYRIKREAQRLYSASPTSEGYALAKAA